MKTNKPPARRTTLWQPLTDSAAKGQFLLQTCDECSTVQYPPREVCRNCLSTSLGWRKDEGDGTVLSMTQLHASVDHWFQKHLPWRIASVKLDSGPVVICHAKEVEIKPGSRVTVLNVRDSSRASSLVAALGDTP